MRVIAVCVSEPKPFEFGGRRGETGIFKEPVMGRVAVGANGLTGDVQVDKKNHGGVHKAVYAYGTGGRDFWARELNIDSLPAGKFGENLLVEGLDESTVAVGDILQVGTARFQVTQPRIPCFKIGVAFASKRMAKDFFDHGRTGVYLRVLEPGDVGAHDECVRTGPSSTAAVMVDQLFEAYFHPARNDDPRQVLQRALEEPALAPNWQEMCGKRLAKIAANGG